MQGAKILIVDDEKVFADTLAHIFNNVHYETRAVYSAEQALEVLDEWVPDLVIVDVVLPKMNGIDLVIKLKSTHPAVVAMLISGQFATGSLAENAAKIGHQFNILAKPVPVADLLTGASKLLSQA
jgi:DNA-binding NtrC family response regulator